MDPAALGWMALPHPLPRGSIPPPEPELAFR